jgi:hypothetical protein
MTYAHGATAADSSMRTIDFKDKFFPGFHWTRQPTVVSRSDALSQFGGKKADSIAEESDGNRTESMHVDNILAGLKQEDLMRDLSVGDSKDGNKLGRIQEK